MQKLNLFMHSFCIGSKLFKEKPLMDLKNAGSTRRRTELEIALGLIRFWFFLIYVEHPQDVLQKRSNFIIDKLFCV